MAKTLLLGQHIAYNGDPLRDLNLSSFLGKFVSKKPKALNARGIFGKGNDEARVNVDSSDFAKLSEMDTSMRWFIDDARYLSFV